ncbi:MAG TPA: helix-turn-helix transcriptional regulator [Terriglobales bacterium]|nr:helix-turn-helix transcriptional regulator [Terriglobales bacterium]
MKTSSQNGSKARSDALGGTPKADSDYLRLLGNNIRAARARRGMTRKNLAVHSGVSERFLAELESGTGNASVLVLRQIAQSLELPLEAVLAGLEQKSEDLVRVVELLGRLDSASIAKARELLVEHFDGKVQATRDQRIALIGLRGAGKSTIGKLLGEKLQISFFELDGLIEQSSGISLAMIFDLYGQSGFRRFERRCLDELLRTHERFVIATGGSLVSEPTTYERLLSCCRTIWLRATPQEHMSRVIGQGDMRPMAQHPEAMSDLERILAEREQLYAQADVTVDTGGKSVTEVLQACVEFVQQAGKATASAASQHNRLGSDRLPV